MSFELTMLVCSGLLAMLMPMTYGYGEMQTPGGLEWGLSNREKPMQFPAWVDRAKRAHNNLLENLTPFAILVLVASISGQLNFWTALGAGLFFFARVAYAAIYIAGLTGVRTVVWAAGTVGQLLILLQLIF
jgi:uncharacterized MAPEG superfamily protein